MFQYRVLNVVKDEKDRRRKIYTILNIPNNKIIQVGTEWFADKRSDMFINAMIKGATVYPTNDKTIRENPLIDEDGWVKREYLKVLDKFVVYEKTEHFKKNTSKFKVIYNVNLNGFREWFFNQFKFKPTKAQAIDTFEAFYEGITELDYIFDKEDKELYDYLMEKTLDEFEYYFTDDDTKKYDVSFRTKCEVIDSPFAIKCIAIVSNFEEETYSEEREQEEYNEAMRREQNSFDYWRNR